MPAYARLATGITLIVTAFVVFALRGGSLEMARDVTIAALLTVVGVGIVVGPWIYRLASDLTAEAVRRQDEQNRKDGFLPVDVAGYVTGATLALNGGQYMVG